MEDLFTFGRGRMNAPAAPARPILDPSVAVDHLLTARWNLLKVQESTVAGTVLWDCMATSMKAVDGAIVDLRKAQG